MNALASFSLLSHIWDSAFSVCSVFFSDSERVS
jgi:hypothetical protein